MRSNTIRALSTRLFPLAVTVCGAVGCVALIFQGPPAVKLIEQTFASQVRGPAHTSAIAASMTRAGVPHRLRVAPRTLADDPANGPIRQVAMYRPRSRYRRGQANSPARRPANNSRSSGPRSTGAEAAPTIAAPASPNAANPDAAAPTVAHQAPAAEESRVYDNALRTISDPQPILADWPQYVEPVVESQRFEANPLIDDANGNLLVRSWRFSYNARGIIEMPNRMRAQETAVIVVHPWGIDDDWGWHEAEPAGVAMNCTPEKNRVYHRHVDEVLNPLLQRLRSRVKIVAYSLPGVEDPIRKKLYSSVRSNPSEEQRVEGEKELREKLAAFEYRGNPLDPELMLKGPQITASYFKAFPGLDPGDKYNGQGFWKLPIPVSTHFNVAPEDVVFYDAEGYAVLRDHLRAHGIKNVLLCGYNTDMCVCRTTAGWENLGPDFNVFLVGDATLATAPANNTPRYATNAAVSFASLSVMITQCSWIQTDD